MKIIMAVYNSLDVDARVQRSALALSEIGDVTLIGIDKEVQLSQVGIRIIKINQKKNAFRYIEFMHKIKRIIKMESFDIFYANDFYVASIAVWVKNRFPKAKLIYDAHELVIPHEGQLWNKRFEYFYQREKKAIHYSDLIISANEDRSKIMQQHFNLDSKPLSIRNISILPIIKDKVTDQLISKLKSFFDSNGTVLVYAGVITVSRNIEKLIDVAVKHINSKLLIVGDGPHLESIRQFGTKCLGNRISFTGSIPYKYLGAILSLCDIGFMNYPTDTLNNIYCAPNKIYEYASVGLPMIANDNPTVKKILDNNMIGIASDDLNMAYEIINNNLYEFKNNCLSFCEENKWDDERNKLINAVKFIYNYS